MKMQMVTVVEGRQSRAAEKAQPMVVAAEEGRAGTSPRSQKNLPCSQQLSSGFRSKEAVSCPSSWRSRQLVTCWGRGEGQCCILALY